jgi:hypothetical protein
LNGRLIFDKEFESRSSSLCSFLHSSYLYSPTSRHLPQQLVLEQLNRATVNVRTQKVRLHFWLFGDTKFWIKRRK